MKDFKELKVWVKAHHLTSYQLSAFSCQLEIRGFKSPTVFEKISGAC
ncbi:hypothetical protein [Okeania sp. KiyG1]|nr:hypothetical protein [Okeania sp. KiyG1]